MRIQTGLVTAALCALGLGRAIAAAQSPQYKVLSSDEIFIYEQSGGVSSVQVLDRSTGTVTAASGVTRVGSSWWDVVFPP